MQKYTNKEYSTFEKSKLDMYKGTLGICIAYGIVAFLLIMLAVFTDTGREYIYNKMLPATITFIIGALVIIFYLVISIYELKPSQRKIKMDMDEGIICPDFWTLKRTDANVKKELVDNSKKAGVFKNITSVNDPLLNYTCEYNPEVYGDLKSYSGTKNNIKDKTNFYKQAVKYGDRMTSNISYLYIEKHNANNNNDGSILSYNDDMLGKYAQFSGIYVSGEITATGEYRGTTLATREIGNTSNITANSILPLDRSRANLDFYHHTKPLICNMLYPQVLANLDKGTPEQNKYRCAYAQACDIAWTDIGCSHHTI